MASLSDVKRSKPIGIHIIEYARSTRISRKTYKRMVLILTFLAYTSYHATRKTTSVVKSVLNPQTSELGFFLWPQSFFLGTVSSGIEKPPRTGSGWAPFNSPDGNGMLGVIDVAFLSMYSFGMYFAGHLGDRIDLRILLTVGMVGTAVFTSLFGVGFWLNIHSFYYYLVIQMFAGAFQSTGWPSVVAVVGNWFGKKNRGLIMGIWNAHTSVGNITGSLIASALLKYGWGWSFAIPGLLMGLLGFIMFVFLPVSPEAVDAENEDKLSKSSKESNATEPLLERGTESMEKPVGFLEAWRIPGVAPFAFCLFFCKLVAYTFLDWLPFYLSHTAIDGQYLSNSAAGTLSTLFDVGGVVGGILAGHLSDYLDARTITAASFMYCAIPALMLYRVYGSISLIWNITLMFITGMFVNGPYALITTSVSADLGTHSSLSRNSRALATVTAIIDGTGSVGAAVGPLLTGYISAKSWSAVFIMLMVSAFIAGLLLTKLVIAEVKAKIETARSDTTSRITSEV
ncbi:glycerol-3-phosphate transporter 1 [Canna indica]|uniref:Glycerol-3-phosphate transporter 1 n=1 Tax=Canna indica TaxID=4628 RepID=A0AAQ3Q195_9LILI|nr:glycerol-3-phosphate transporter 1 [Canna indica]